MSKKDIQIDGGALSAAERLDLWRDVVGDLLADVDLNPSPSVRRERAFEGTLRARVYDSATLADIASGWQVIDRTHDRIRRDRSDDVLFNVVFAGQCGVEQDGRHAVAHPGGVFIYDATRPYHIETSGEFRTLAVVLDRGRMERALGDLRFYTAQPLSSSLAPAMIAVEFWRSLVEKLDVIDDATASELIDAGVDVIISALSAGFDQERRSESCDLTLWRAEAFISRSFHRDDLTLDEIAAAAGVSKRRLQECFQSKGRTPMEVLRHYRLRHARRRLQDPKAARISILTIMNCSGFSDPAHFSKAFRKEFGLSPREARRACGSAKR